MSVQTTTTPPPPVPVPRKSRRRLYLIGAFFLLLLGTPTAYYFYAGWARDQRLAKIEAQLDAEDPDWRWPDLVAAIDAKAPPDDANSAVHIARVQKLLRANNPLGGVGKWENAPWHHRNARLAPEYVEALRGAFKEVPKETVEEIRKLKDMPAGAFKFEAVEIPFALRLDYVQDTRQIANFLQWDAAMRAHDGDLDGAAESSLAILNTANALKDQPFLIGQLVRVAEQAVGIAAIERTLGQGPISEANLIKLQTALEKHVLDDGLYTAMRGERAAGHQSYLSLRSGKTTFGDLFGQFGMKVSATERLVEVFPGIVLNGYPEYLALMNENVGAAKLKDTERSDALTKVDQDARKARSNLLIMMIMPATSKVGEATMRLQAQQRTTIAALATERYRLKHNGNWPRNLDDVVKAGLLKEVPIDPYDGKPLRFKRTPTGIIIYSIYLDRVDDGGKLDRVTGARTGVDIGFELFDRRAVPPIIEEK